MSSRPTTTRNPTNRLLGIVLILCVCLVLVACGGRSEETATSAEGEENAATSSDNGVPTMPAARFAQPTTIIQLDETGAITESAETADSGAITDTASAAETPDAPALDLERGARVYANNGCNECHGDEGEGVQEKGGSLAGLSLSEAKFEDVLRTGGEIGADHLYGPNALSPSGLSAMYAWLASLSNSE